MSVSKPSRQSSVRAYKYDRAHTLSIDVDMASLDDVLTELGDKVDAAVRPAAQAAAEVLYQAVLKNVDAIGSVSGNLRASIYQKFIPEQSTDAKAAYAISWRTSGQGAKAPHGHLIEYGHIQRYAVHLGKDGKWHTLVRPSMRGKPKPSRRASQAERDAYYVPRAGGPQQIPAHPFIRPVVYQAGAAAIEAAKNKLYDALDAK